MQEEQNAASYNVPGRKPCPLKKVAVLPISLLILSMILCVQKVQLQEITDREISELEQQLKATEAEVIQIDNELKPLTETFNSVTGEIDKLKQELREPKSGIGRIFGIFDYRKRGKLEQLYAQSQELADRISFLRKKRDPLIREFVTLADALIERSSLRITALLGLVREAIAANDTATRNRASKQVSALWQLAEKTTAARSKYAPAIPGQERVKLFTPPLSDDPIELRLSAAILKDEAKTARSEAARLRVEQEKLQLQERTRKLLLETWKEIQRSNEERESMSVQAGTTNIPWGFNESAIKKEISEIREKIDKLSARIREYEANAESFENQSKNLEQRASQIEAKLKGKS